MVAVDREPSTTGGPTPDRVTRRRLVPATSEIERAKRARVGARSGPVRHALANATRRRLALEETEAMHSEQPRPVIVGDVTECELPGIGKRYDVHAADGAAVTVVIHHSGRRDLYVHESRNKPRADVTLTDTQARSLGAILGGAYFKPAAIEAIEAVIGGLLIDWCTLDDASPGVGKTIAELQVRSRTKMTIAAILRDQSHIVAPEPTERLRSGDRLVVIGRQVDLAGFRRVIVRD
jgi:TrkA domain protein